MIERYTRPEMGRFFTEEAKFESWLVVELAHLEVLEARATVPAGTAAKVRSAARIDVSAIEAIEATVQHDVIAFLKSITDGLGAPGRYVHLGLTSSDLVDTAQALRLRDAGRVLVRGVDGLLEVLQKRALEERGALMIGRTHGVHAEPTTFGLKVLGWFEELRRGRGRLKEALQALAVGKMSGAVGTFAHLPPAVEEAVMERLGLGVDPVSTQIVQRDRHAAWMTAIAVTGGTLERIATEVRNLQHTELLEVEEPFAKGQRGSSSMPHKRNPIRCERITGLARLLRANAMAALENMALWHERDISHSSVERVIFADSMILADYMLALLTEVVDGLIVHRERMRQNLELSRGLIYSQRVLLGLCDAGLSRDQAYQLVQRHAMAAWRQGRDFRDDLAADPEVNRHLSPEALVELCDPTYYVRHEQAIFERVLRADQACGVEVG